MKAAKSARQHLLAIAEAFLAKAARHHVKGMTEAQTGARIEQLEAIANDDEVDGVLQTLLDTELIVYSEGEYHIIEEGPDVHIDIGVDLDMSEKN